MATLETVGFSHGPEKSYNIIIDFFLKHLFKNQILHFSFKNTQIEKILQISMELYYNRHQMVKKLSKIIFFFTFLQKINLTKKIFKF